LPETIGINSFAHIILKIKNMKKRSFIYRIFRKIFPKRVESFSEFIKILRQKRVISVLIKPQINDTWINNVPLNVYRANNPRCADDFFPPPFIISGPITFFQYNLKFMAITLDGTTIVYNEEVLRQSETAFDRVSLDEKRDANEKLLSTGKESLKSLQDEFPRREVKLVA